MKGVNLMLKFLDATAGAAEAGATGGFLSSPAMTIVMLVAMVALKCIIWEAACQ